MKIRFTKELIQFAEEFSENYKLLSCGRYKSSKGRYEISYLKTLYTSPLYGKKKIVNTPIRVNAQTNVMEFNKPKLKSSKYTKDFIFLFVIWCYCITKTFDYEEADKIALKKYLKIRRNKKDIDRMEKYHRAYIYLSN